MGKMERMKIKIERKSALELILGEEKKMPQGLSAEYTHKQTYVNTAHRAPLPHSSFCHMTHKKNKKHKAHRPQNIQGTQLTETHTSMHRRTHSRFDCTPRHSSVICLQQEEGELQRNKHTACVCTSVQGGR